jgi:hypothetical protein
MTQLSWVPSAEISGTWTAEFGRGFFSIVRTRHLGAAGHWFVARYYRSRRRKHSGVSENVTGKPTFAEAQAACQRYGGDLPPAARKRKGPRTERTGAY